MSVLTRFHWVSHNHPGRWAVSHCLDMNTTHHHSSTHECTRTVCSMHVRAETPVAERASETRCKSCVQKLAKAS